MIQRPFVAYSGPLRVVVATAVAAVLIVPLVTFDGVVFPYVVPKMVVLRSALGIAFLAHLATLLTRGHELLDRRDPIATSLAVFLIVGTLAGLLGVAPLRSIFGDIERAGGAIAWFYLLLWYAVLRSPPASERWTAILGAALLVGLAVTCVAVLQRYGHLLAIDVRGASRGSVHATLGNPSYLGIYAVLNIAIALLLRERLHGRSRTLCAAAVLPLLFGLTLSGGRSAFAALVVGAAAGGAVLLSGRAGSRDGSGVASARGPIGRMIFRDRAAGRWAIAAALVVTVSVLGGAAMVDRLGSWTSISRTVAVRLDLWQAGWRQAAEAPVLGIGGENFRIAVSRHYPVHLHGFGGVTWDRAHNGYLEVLVAAGVVGLLAYLAIWFSFFGTVWVARRRGDASRREAAVLTAAGVAYLVYLLMWFDDISSSLILVVIFAYASTLRSRGPLLATGARRAGSRRRIALVALAAAVVALFTYQRAITIAVAARSATLAIRAPDVESRIARYDAAVGAAGPEALVITGLYVDFLRSFAGRLDEIGAHPERMRLIWGGVGRALLGLERAIAVDPLNDVWWVDRSRILLFAAEAQRDGRYYAASLDAMERAVALSPGKISLRYLHSDLLLAAGRADAAVDPLLQALRIDDTLGETYDRLARALASQGELGGSRRALLRAMELGYVSRTSLLVWHLNRAAEAGNSAAERRLLEAYWGGVLAPGAVRTLTAEEFSVLSRRPLLALRGGDGSGAIGLTTALLDRYPPAAAAMRTFIADVGSGAGTVWGVHTDLSTAARSFGGLGALDRWRR